VRTQDRSKITSRTTRHTPARHSDRRLIRPGIERLEPRRLLSANVAVFYDPGYVNTVSGGDGDDLLQQLAHSSQNYNVTTFSGVDAPSFSNALSNANVLVIPALDNGDLSAVLPYPTKVVLNSYLQCGGSLIVVGSAQDRATNFLSSVFNYTGIVDQTAQSKYNATSNILGTAFSADFLSGNTTVYPLSAAALPAGSSDLYDSIGGDSCAVALLPVTGVTKDPIVYLGYDWGNGGPTQDSAWNQSLDDAISQLQGTVVPVSITPPANQTAIDGISQSFNLGSFTAFATGNYSIGINWGDGPPYSFFGQSLDGTIEPQQHIYAGDNTYSATETVTDSAGHSASATFSVIVGRSVTPTKLAFSSIQPTAGTAGVALSPTIAVNVEDASGNVVTGATPVVTLVVTEGPQGGTLIGNATVQATNGVATFSNLSFDVAGQYTLTATNGVLSSDNHAPITISPAPPAKLAVLSQPTTGVAGASLFPSLLVGVEDAFNNLQPNYESDVSVALASGPAGATLGGQPSVPTAQGIATFNTLSFSAAGTYTLIATDGSLVKTAIGSITISGGATKLVIAQQASTGLTGAPTSIVVNAEDSTGKLVPTNGSTVSLALASGPTGGALSGTTSAQVTNGAAIFSGLSFNIPGTYTLKATDGTLTPALSSPITVAATGLAKLVVIQQPTAGTAGTPPTPAIEVRAEDALGNLAINDTSSVNFRLVSGPNLANIVGATTVQLVSGVATFTGLTFDTAGTYTFKVTDGLLKTTSATPITIAPAAPAQLVFAQQPTTAIAGSALSPSLVVKVEDAFGNVVTSNSSTVTLGLADAPTGGTLTGTASIKAVKGVATFSGLSLKVPGAYTIKATDGSLLAAKSSPITVFPAGAAKLVITQQPTTGKHGNTLSPTLIAQVQDALGHVVTTDSSTITLMIASGPAGAKINGTVSIKAVKGIATFGKLSLSKAGTYTFKVIDGKLAAAISKNVVVS
jgi:hypothetical protein